MGKTEKKHKMPFLKKSSVNFFYWNGKGFYFFNGDDKDDLTYFSFLTKLVTYLEKDILPFIL